MDSRYRGLVAAFHVMPMHARRALCSFVSFKCAVKADFNFGAVAAWAIFSNAVISCVSTADQSPITFHLSHFQTFPRLQDRNFRFAFSESGKLFRVADQGWKSAVMDRYNHLWMEELDRFGGVLGSHNEMFADG